MSLRRVDVSARLFIVLNHRCFAASTRLLLSSNADEDRATEHSLSDTLLLRPRKHGNPSLPISPLLAGEKPRADRRSKTPRKVQQSEDLTDFQKALALNPYALALATSVRHCSLTSAKLPKHFLLPFSTSVTPPAPTSSDKSKAFLQPVHHSKLSEALPATSYVLNDASIISHLSKKSHWRTLVTERMKQHFAPIVQKNPKNINVKDFWSWKTDQKLAREGLERDVHEAVARAMEFEDGRLIGVARRDDGETACVIVPPDFSGDVEALSQGSMPVYQMPAGPARSSDTDGTARETNHLNIVEPVGFARHELTAKLQLTFDRLNAYNS